MLGLALRLLVTAAGIALPTLLVTLPLPGLEPDAWGEPFGMVDAPALSIGALGLDGVLLAFVLVEIVARLVPRLRPLRFGQGRVKLMRVTFVLAATLLIVQGLLVSWALRNNGETYVMFAPGLGPILLDTAAALLGSVVLLVAARAVTRWGCGHGLSVVVVLGQLPFWLEERGLGAQREDPEAFARTLLLTTFAAVLVLGRDLRGERLPVAGLLPLMLPAWTLQVLSLVGFFLSLEWLEWAYRPSLTAVISVVALIAVALSVLADRDRSLFNVRARGGVIAVSAIVPLAIVVGDLAIDWPVSFVSGAGGLCFFVLALACALDVLREAGLRANVRLVPILAFSSIRVVDAVGRRLAEADIPFVMRGALHRTLLRFFGPWVPVKLLVPADRVEEAKLLARGEAQREAYDEIIDAF